MLISLHVNFTARVWQNFKFWTANPPTGRSHTIACKNNETFDISFYFCDYSPPPSGQFNVEKKNDLTIYLCIVRPTLLGGGGGGGNDLVVSIIFARDCSYITTCLVFVSILRNGATFLLLLLLKCQTIIS